MPMLQVVFCRSPTDGNVCGAFRLETLAGLFKRQAWMRKYLVRIEDVHVESFLFEGHRTHRTHETKHFSAFGSERVMELMGLRLRSM